MMRKIMICAKDIESLVRNNNLVTFVNPYSMYILQEKKLLKRIFDEFDYIGIDGIGLVKAIQIKYKVKNLERVSFDMTSLAPKVFKHAINNNKSIYFIGTKEHIIPQTIKNIKKTYPELNIIGYRHGYFKDRNEYNKVISSIKRLNPDIVIAGLGTPLQELFLLDLKKLSWQGTGFTCGGFLEQTAQSINYYPKVIDKLHLRWLYRLYKEPRRLPKRYFYIYPKFFIKFFTDRIEL